MFKENNGVSVTRSSDVSQNLAMHLQLQQARERLSMPTNILAQQNILSGLSGLTNVDILGPPGRCPDSEQNPEISNIQQIQAQAMLQQIQLQLQIQQHQQEQTRAMINFSPVPDQSRKRSISSNSSSRRLSEEHVSGQIGLTRNSPSPGIPPSKSILNQDVDLQHLAALGKSSKKYIKIEKSISQNFNDEFPFN